MIRYTRQFLASFVQLPFELHWAGHTYLNKLYLHLEQTQTRILKFFDMHFVSVAQKYLPIKTLNGYEFYTKISFRCNFVNVC